MKSDLSNLDPTIAATIARQLNIEPKDNKSEIHPTMAAIIKNQLGVKINKEDEGEQL